ncbi:MFS transporter [Leadbettera azotonutricia]|uniref:Transporter, major facilitator family n=1 Tax=Leadbettera azotonutricia (strain ATCC BAA-888 / DSM 13862 / ZAS-9) TaxID=545695 RepID=F5Y9K5_LEAAZ|nr:MFS transporter [Leadbettera azotonutricia]AEF80734.1 transporter, major facilitator family [Leadbettera azotonutricia ZAS-9]
MLISGSLILLLMGLLYGWSIIALPLEREFAWTRDKTSLIFVAVMVFFTSGVLAGGPVSKRFSPGVCIRISGFLIFAGFVLASRVDSVWGMCLSYGFLCGLGIGITYNVVLTATLFWFPGKTGLASGFLLGGFGLGSFALGPAVSALINSSMGWRRGFLIIGAVFLVLVFVESFIICKPKEGEIEQESHDSGEGGKNPVERNSSPGEMLGSPFFRRMYLWGTVLSSCTVGILGIGALFASDMGAGYTLAAVMSGFLSIGNGGGRIAFGLVYDRFGRKFSMRTGALFFLSGVTLLIISHFTANLLLVGLGYFFAGLCCGALPPIYSCTCRKYFGPRYFSWNIGLFNSTNIPAVLIGNFAAGILRSKTGSYLPVFGVMAIFSILAFGIEFAMGKAEKNIPGSGSC